MKNFRYKAPPGLPQRGGGDACRRIAPSRPPPRGRRAYAASALEADCVLLWTGLASQMMRTAFGNESVLTLQMKHTALGNESILTLQVKHTAFDNESILTSQMKHTAFGNEVNCIINEARCICKRSGLHSQMKHAAFDNEASSIHQRSGLCLTMGWAASDNGA